jgi:protein-L-isoaspartate O-methyltransferase
VGPPEVLEGYAVDAAELVAVYEAFRTPDVLEPMQELLPARPSRILDVGAGTGRDAAFLVGEGHSVVAVEPVHAFRQAGLRLHPLERIRWLDDQLPALARVLEEATQYELIIVSGVWQHLPPEQHQRAINALSALLAAEGRLMISLRHGPGSPARPCFPADPDRIVAYAEGAGMRLRLRDHVESLQQRNRDLGVTWTWLCFERG